MQIIPFNLDGSFLMQISLTQNVFNLQFHWNALNEFWVMDILDVDFNPVIFGIKVVPNYDISGQYTYPNMPSGDIVCQNFQNQWGPIGRFDMGSTCELVYYEPGEWETTSPVVVVDNEVA